MAPTPGGDGFLHEAAAVADEAEGVGEGEGAGGDEGRNIRRGCGRLRSLVRGLVRRGHGKPRWRRRGGLAGCFR